MSDLRKALEGLVNRWAVGGNGHDAESMDLISACSAELLRVLDEHPDDTPGSEPAKVIVVTEHSGRKRRFAASRFAMADNGQLAIGEPIGDDAPNMIDPVAGLNVGRWADVAYEGAELAGDDSTVKALHIAKTALTEIVRRSGDGGALVTAATPGQAALSLLAEVLSSFSATSLVGGQLKGDAVSCVGMSDLRRWREQAAALAAREPQPAPGRERNALEEIARAVQGCTDAGIPHDYEWILEQALDGLGWLPDEWERRKPELQPAPELAAKPDLRTAWRLADERRELLDEIGVMAANASEGGDSFAVLEEIAMRIAAHGVPEEGK